MNTSDFFHQITLNFQAFLDISPCKLTFRLCFNAPFCKGNSNHAGFCIIEFYGSQRAPNFLGRHCSVQSLCVSLRFLPHGAQPKENSYSLHDLNPQNQLSNITAKHVGISLVFTQVIYYQAKQCIIIREIPEIYHRFALFDSPEMGNTMATVFFSQSSHLFLKKNSRPN